MKKRLVAKELQNDNWIMSISRLNSMDQLCDFTLVTSILAEVTLDPLQPDSKSPGFGQSMAVTLLSWPKMLSSLDASLVSQ
jgi:hypothetical protein